MQTSTTEPGGRGAGVDWHGLAVGPLGEPVRRRWSADDAMLYALAVGAGQADPLRELQFTTDNTENVPVQALPSFATTAMDVWIPMPESLDLSRMLHAGQAFELDTLVPPDGEVTVDSAVTSIYDKGSGALVTIESEARDERGVRVARLERTLFFRGHGDFGGARGPRSNWAPPPRIPDLVTMCPTRHDQALLYRLTGDRNPIHTDPGRSVSAGFSRPILHGMCTFGIAGRVLLHSLAGSDPARLTSMSGRFSAPTFPGEDLTISAWVTGSDVLYVVTGPDGRVLIDRGTATIAPKSVAF